MNKQCQEPQAHPDRCGCVREIAEHNAQAYAEAIAAIAAKDARIAELEAERDEWRRLFNEAGTVSMNARSDLAQLVAKIERLETASGFACSLADEVRAALAATPSEDGGEVPEVVAWRNDDRESVTTAMCAVMDWDDENERVSPLMTIAQHSRIVAAKDAEISKFKEANRELGESNVRRRNKIVELMQKLDAQPARQVGWDEREQFEAWGETLFFSSCFEREDSGEYAGRGLQGAWLGWQARAALAPAAVVKKYTWEEIVGLVSEVLGCEYRRDPVFFIGHQMPGINFNSLSRIIDRVQHREVARLNRRAIPEGLIEASRRAADILGSQGFAAWDQLAAELRALLGKEGD